MFEVGEYWAYRAVCRASFVDLEASGKNEADCPPTFASHLLRVDPLSTLKGSN